LAEEFCQRHPELSFWRVEPLAFIPSVYGMTEVVDKYLTSWKWYYVDDKKLFSKSGLVFNCDESKMALNYHQETASKSM